MAEVKSVIELHPERLGEVSLIDKLLLKTKLDRAVKELRDGGLQIALSDEKVNGFYKSLIVVSQNGKYADSDRLLEHVFSVMAKYD